ncbi:hypothetical protein Cni_G22349 [Canna indica]|uniref:Uncharacterized protein n=1 Tax=Canna indica TaxID=4628 RepID=A0AAQ3KSB1_9LILI|nr:hypothetical protein Cni_G22349 [Canna indica]
MTTRCKVQLWTVLLLVAGLLMIIAPAQGRLLHDSRVGEKFVDYVRDVVVEGMKTGGPSPGIGHKMTNVSLDDVKDSGPSPGIGH